MPTPAQPPITTRQLSKVFRVPEREEGLGATLRAFARRRFKELQENGGNAIYERVLQDMKDRDARDSQRRAAPLVPAGDAFVLDTTALDADAALAAALDFIGRKLVGKPPRKG